MSDEAAAPESQVPAKKAMNPLVLVLIASLVTASTVGGGVYFALASKVDSAAAAAEAADEEEGGEVASTAAKKKAKGKKGKEQKKDPALYVKLDPPFVVNFEAKGIMRFLQIAVEVMTRDNATVDLLRQHDPLIRNNLLMLFSNQDFQKINSVEGREALRVEALKAIGEALKSEGGKPKDVEQLYFTSFVMQ
jgi:flagellar FliL protein